MQSWAGLAALAAFLTTAGAQLTHIGNITVFSDPACSEAVFANNWSVGRDFCASVDDSASFPVDKPFRSYIINERPWCDNGSRPYLNVYKDEQCADLIESYEPGALYDPEGPDADGTCVVPRGNYRAMAFVCDGFEGTWGNQDVATVVSSEIGEATETLTLASMVTTVMSTAPNSSISSTPRASSESQATTEPSITASATNGTGTIPSATTSAPTSAFTGAGSNLATHIPAIIFGVPLAILLV